MVALERGAVDVEVEHAGSRAIDEAAMKSALVVGGTGYIGTCVVRELIRLASPWQTVRILTRSEASAAKASALGAEPVMGNLSEPGAWCDVARTADFVVHCAQPSPRTEDYGIRVQQEANLLDALDANRSARCVFVYGSSYYGASDGPTPIDETTPPRPFGVGPYFARCIAEVEARRKQGLDIVAAFAGGVYGRGAWFVEALLDSLRKQAPVLVCDPAPLWPYIHVEDCARAIAALLVVERDALDRIGRDVILADDEPAAMDRFIELIGQAVGCAPVIVRRPADALRTMMSPITATYFCSNMPHSNARLRRLGVELKYPRIEDGIASLDLGSQR
jgi:nucleoside-diphosphate-sugar epimerase